MEDRFEKPTKLEPKGYLMRLERQSLENDINIIRISIRVMKRWVKREFMTEEEEKLLKKGLDLK